jgi:hypothetical protein
VEGQLGQDAAADETKDGQAGAGSRISRARGDSWCET